MTQKRRVFTAEFKRDAVDLWKNSDRTARQVAVELGLSTGILPKWNQQLTVIERENRELSNQAVVCRDGCLGERLLGVARLSQPKVGWP
jgi:transposase-like protein